MDQKKSKKILESILKLMKMKTTCQHLKICGTLISEKFMALKPYVRKEEWTQINEFKFYLKYLEKQKLIKLKVEEKW